MSRTIAAGDIGGTHIRFAFAEASGGTVVLLGEPIIFRTADQENLQSAWEEFGRRTGTSLPSALALAFAGSIDGPELRLTNSSLVVDRDQLGKQLGVDEIMIINDFGAVAHAVAQLGSEHWIHSFGPEGPLPEKGMTTIVGLGTGLGVAQLLRTADSYHVIETEGGHVDFAPVDELEDRMLTHLRRKLSRVSVERIVSGSGLENLYEAMGPNAGYARAQPVGELIWKAALDGSDPLAVAALDRLLLSFGSVAGDLALAHGANAVVIAGGLGYRLKDRLMVSGFAERFVAKGRFRERMETIPVKLLNHPQPGLYGAAAAFAKEHP